MAAKAPTTWANRISHSHPPQQQAPQQKHRRPPQSMSYARQPPMQGRAPQQRQMQPRQMPPQQRQPQVQQMQQRRVDPLAALKVEMEKNGERMTKIRKVLSADTLICEEASTKKEITVTLDGIQCPRPARSQNQADEFFAFEAREYLRKELVGSFARVKTNKQLTRKTGGEEAEAVAVDGWFYGEVLVIQKPSPADSPMTRMRLGADTQWESVTKFVVSAGYGIVKTQGVTEELRPRKEMLQQIESQARAAKKGRFAVPNPGSQQFRVTDWRPDVQSLFSTLKGQEVPAVVEDIRDGSTLRLELLLHEQKESKNLQTAFVYVCMSGIRAEPIPKPDVVQRREYESRKRDGRLKAHEQNGFVKQEASVLAKAAAQFTKRRLVHQDVTVRLDNIDPNGNLYGSVQHSQGDIATLLLSNGLAQVVEWHLLEANSQSFQAAENHAQTKKLGLWQTRQPRKKMARTKECTIVTQVFSGDAVGISKGTKENGELITDKVYLASIRCPRSRNRYQRDSIDEPYCYEAKEFVRAALVGKEIRVQTQYSRTGQPRQDQPTPPELHYVAIFYDNGKNIAEELIRNGLAQLIPHAKTDSRAYNYLKLQTLESDAKAKKKNQWCDDQYEPPRFEDLTLRNRDENSNERTRVLKRSLEFAKSLGLKVQRSGQRTRGRRNFDDDTQQTMKMKGIVEYVFSATRMKVLLTEQKKKITVILSGMRGQSKDPREGSGETKPSEAVCEVIDSAKNYVRNHVQQKEVWVQIENFLDRSCNFVGHVFTQDKTNIGLQILRMGAARILEPSARRSIYEAELRAAEEDAKQGQLGVWEGWVEEEEQPEQPRQYEEPEVREDGAPKREARRKQAPHAKEGTSVRGSVTHVHDGATFYIVEEGSETSTTILNHMKTVNPVSNPLPDTWAPAIGDVVAGLFHDGYYRFKITGVRKTDNSFFGVFIDFGNTSSLKEEQLLPINERDIEKLQGQALRCTLAFLKPPPTDNPAYFNQAGNYFQHHLFGVPLDISYVQVRRERRVMTHEVVLMTTDGQNMNHVLVSQGFARVYENKLRDKDLEGDDAKLAPMIAEYRELQKAALESHTGMWQYGEVATDDEDTGRGRGRGRRRENRV